MELDPNQPFPAGCYINNIRQGVDMRSQFIYADFRAPDDTLLIGAALNYIESRIREVGIERPIRKPQPQEKNQ
jgi:hypothetical protein